jgi:DNA-binding MarR family transcriptional regulator
MHDSPLKDVHGLTSEEQRLWRSFVELSNNLRAAVDGQLARDGRLSCAEYEVLDAISRSRTRVVRQRDLGVELGWRYSRLSHLLTRMISRGLLERLTPEAARRGAGGRRGEVRLTPAGRLALAGAAAGHIETVRSVMLDLLTPQEREAVVSIAGKVADEVRRRGLGGRYGYGPRAASPQTAVSER